MLNDFNSLSEAYSVDLQFFRDDLESLKLNNNTSSLFFC